VVLVPPGAPPRLIEGGLSPPLGAPVTEPVTEERREVRVDVPPGSVLLLYTDGMVEDRRAGLDAGLSALLDCAGRLVAEHGEDVDGLAAALLAAARSEERSDDIALLVARSTGRDRRAQPDVPGRRTRTVRPGAVLRGAAVDAVPVRLEEDARRSTGDDVLESVP
jgi:hypothetical protein